MDEIIQYYNEHKEEIEEVINRATIKSEILSIIADKGAKSNGLMVQVALNTESAIDNLLNETLEEIYVRDDAGIAEFAPNIDLTNHIILMLATVMGETTHVHMTTAYTYDELGLSHAADGLLQIDEQVLLDCAKHDALLDRIKVISMQVDYHAAAREAAGSGYQDKNQSVVMTHVRNICKKYAMKKIDFETALGKLDSIMNATAIK